jgi:hypothetical protein
MRSVVAMILIGYFGVGITLAPTIRSTPACVAGKARPRRLN